MPHKMIFGDAVEELVRERIDSIPERLRAVRGHRTQTELAIRIETFTNAVQQAEAGRRKPVVDFFAALGMVENIDLNWLILGRPRYNNNGLPVYYKDPRAHEPDLTPKPPKPPKVDHRTRKSKFRPIRSAAWPQRERG